MTFCVIAGSLEQDPALPDAWAAQGPLRETLR